MLTQSRHYTERAKEGGVLISLKLKMGECLCNVHEYINEISLG